MLARLKFEISDLVKEMMDQVDPGLFVFSETTFLDPAMGGGQFIFETIKRLKDQGHSNANIKSRVFGYESNILYVNYIKELYFRLHGEEIPATLSVGGLDELESLKMRFDLVMGNPPYQEAISSTASNYIFQNFIHKCVGLKPDMFCFIIPDNWIIRNDKMGKMIRSDLKTMGLKKVEGIDSSVFSSVSVNTCFVICEKGFSGKVEMIKTFITDLDKRLIDKICSKEKTGVKVTDCNRLPIGSYAIVSAFRSVDVRNIPLNPIMLKEIETDQKGSAYAAFEWGKKENMEQRLTFYKSFYSSIIIRYLLQKTRTSYGLRTPQLAFVPKLPMNRIWTDEELYAHFGLTQEEIEYIESQVK